MKMWQILNQNLLVSVSEFRAVVSVSNTDTIPPGIARLIPIPRVSLNSTKSKVRAFPIFLEKALKMLQILEAMRALMTM